MDQINSFAGPRGDNDHLNTDQIKAQMKDRAEEFMNLESTQKKIRHLLGKGQRFSISIDDVRKFDPKLSAYIAKNPIDAIKMFEDTLNQIVRGLQEDSGK